MAFAATFIQEKRMLKKLKGGSESSCLEEKSDIQHPRRCEPFFFCARNSLDRHLARDQLGSKVRIKLQVFFFAQSKHVKFDLPQAAQLSIFL